MNKPLTIRSITLVGLLFAPSFAFADVVAGKPTSCPSGSHLVTNHNGSDCAPDTCPPGSQPNLCDGHGCCKVELCRVPEGACDDGLTCNITRLCATPARKAPNDRYREITGSCDNGSKCAAGSTCEVIASCVPKKSAFSGCSCDLAQKNPHNSEPLLASAVAFAALVYRLSSRRHARIE